MSHHKNVLSTETNPAAHSYSPIVFIVSSTRLPTDALSSSWCPECNKLLFQLPHFILLTSVEDFEMLYIAHFIVNNRIDEQLK